MAELSNIDYGYFLLEMFAGFWFVARQSDCPHFMPLIRSLLEIILCDRFISLIF